MCLGYLNNIENFYNGKDNAEIIYSKAVQMFHGKDDDMRTLLEKELKSGDLAGLHHECLTDTWIGRDRWAFIDLTVGPFSWGPAVGRKGVHTEHSLPNVGKTIGAIKGEPYEIYHVVLKSKSFLEKMTVIQHTIPFFLPVRDVENDHLSSNAMKSIDYVGAILQGFVDRREQVCLIKELYGNQIKELYHTLSYNMIEFTVNDFDCRETISLRYADIVLTLPSRIRVLAWPVHPSKKISPTDASGTGSILAQSTPYRLPFAEELLRMLCLPEGAPLI